MSTRESFHRFMGATPYEMTEDVSRALTDLERRGVVWVTRLDEPPFGQLRSRVAGQSVLALGSLEGNLEWHLATAGASRVVGVEGFVENYEKCALLKALFPSLPLEFHRAAVEDLDVSAEYDIIVCPGILYHVTNPAALLEKLRAMNTARLFLSTQLAVNPPHPSFRHYKIGEIGEVRTSAGRYFGRWVPDRRSGSHDYRSGLHGTSSFWFFPGDLRRLLEDIGFSVVSFNVADLGDRGVVVVSEMTASRRH